MSARGKVLEGMVRRAAIAYRKDGRACLVQQQPRTGTGPGGTVIYAGSAPIDFLGAIGDSAGAVECKESSTSRLDLREFGYGTDDTEQYESLNAVEDYGFDVRLVVHLTTLDEAYVVPWFQVRAFAEAPWRKSLSLHWLRAHGQVAPIVRDGKKLDRCLFLDAAAHPESERCLLEVWDERKHRPIVSLDGPDTLADIDEPMPAWGSAYAGMTPEQIRAQLEDAVREGVENAAKREKRQRKWYRRRAAP